MATYNISKAGNGGIIISATDIPELTIQPSGIKEIRLADNGILAVVIELATGRNIIIYPATDPVVLAGTTMAAGSNTPAQLKAAFDASSVFQKANTGTGGTGTATTDASQLTTGTLPDTRLSSNVALKTYVDNAVASVSVDVITDGSLTGSGTDALPLSAALTPTAVKTSAYTAAANDLVKTDATSASVTITLPLGSGLLDKTKVGVKMIAVSGSFVTTIATSGTDVLNKAGGSTSATLSLLNQTVTFQYEMATGIWSIISSDVPLSQMDLRYATAAGLTTANSNISSNTTAIAAKADKATTITINGTTQDLSANRSWTVTGTGGNPLFLGAYSKSGRDAISSPVAGNQVFNTDDGWYDYYDSFWGWMPMSMSFEWKRHYGWEYFNDFISTSGDAGLLSNTANGGSITNNVSISGATAESGTTVIFSLSTNANARAGFASGGSSGIELGSGQTVYEGRFYMPLLSNATDRFQLIAGFFDNAGGVDQVDGVYLLYDEGGVTTGSTASANWQLVTSSNSTRTITASSSAVAATTWYTLRVEVNAAGTLATFYVNGTSIGTSSTNIPTGVFRVTGFGAVGIKSVGTTTRNIFADYIGAKQKFTTPR